MHSRAFASKRDVIILLLVVVCALAGWLLFSQRQGAGAIYAQVYVEGKAIQRVALDRDQQFFIPQRPQVLLEVRDGQCGFVCSDCPDQVCVYAGFLHTPGQYAACLPNGMVLRIEEDGDSGVDIVAY